MRLVVQRDPRRHHKSSKECIKERTFPIRRLLNPTNSALWQAHPKEIQRLKPRSFDIFEGTPPRKRRKFSIRIPRSEDQQKKPRKRDPFSRLIHRNIRSRTSSFRGTIQNRGAKGLGNAAKRFWSDDPLF